MKIYAHYGFREFVLCLGYKGEQIKQYFLSYEAVTRDVTIRLGAAPEFVLHGAPAEPWTITLVETGAAAMTGARVKRAERYVDGDTFMLTYGDGVVDIPVDKLLAFHRGHGRLGTVTGVRPPSRFGELVASGTRVVEFSEKPSISAPADQAVQIAVLGAAATAIAVMVSVLRSRALAAAAPQEPGDALRRPLGGLGIFRATGDGQIVECNEAFVRMLGFASAAEIVGRHIRSST